MPLPLQRYSAQEFDRVAVAPKEMLTSLEELLSGREVVEGVVDPGDNLDAPLHVVVLITTLPSSPKT